MIDTNDKTQIDAYKDKLNFLQKQITNNGYDEDKLRFVITCNMFPKDGIILPSGKEPYVFKNPNCSLGVVVRERIKKVDGISEYDTEKMETLKNQSEKYMPYSTKFVSVVYGAINGLYADYFATNFIIIDKFKNIVQNRNILSLKPETCLFVNQVELSNEAVILINADKYESLKVRYPELARYNVIQYKGDASLALAMQLVKDDVVPEKMTKDYVCDSVTSDKLVDFVTEYASKNGIGTGRYIDTEFFKSDQDKTTKLQQIFDEAFYSFLLKRVNIPESHYAELLKRLCEGDAYDSDNLIILDGIIESIGASGILSIVNEFNSKIDDNISKGLHPTNEGLLVKGKIELN